MKNLLLLVCLVCCQIIASQCSLEQLAKELRVYPELLAECHDGTEVLNSNLVEFLTTPVRNLDSSRKADLTQSVGCLLACILEKLRLMNGAKIDREALREASKRVNNSNWNRFARLVEHVEACADSVEPLSDRCEVAITFHRCTHSRPTSQ